MTRTIALWTSYIFEPFLTSTLIFGLVLLKLDASVNEIITWGLLAAFFGALPPVAVFLYEKKKGKIKDWLITNRLERRDVHLAWIFGSGILSLVYWQLSTPRLLIAFTLSLFALSIVITLATFRWKISVHIVGVTMLVLVLLLVYSSAYLPGVLIIALVAWSRIYVGHHTLSQVTAASILTIMVIYFVFSQFGLATF